MNIRMRFLKLKWYLSIYNTTLRYCQNDNRSEELISWLNHMWDHFSWAEQQFILAREEW